MLNLLQHFLRIDAREVEFARRGFTGSDPQIQLRLENIGRVFLRGYHCALAGKHPAGQLEQVELEHRGFAYEGAAMALALRDELSFGARALPRFISGDGQRHLYMLHVGAGWAYARLPWRRRLEAVLTRFHPVLRWLIIDGYGFHQGYFHAREQGRIAGSMEPLSVDARHVFHQGLGRSLWFSRGADAQAIARSIASLPALYGEDAWSGVGLACAYAGGVLVETIATLRRLAGEHAAAMAQGAAFAAKARQLASNPAAHTETACAVLCGMPAQAAAALCDLKFQQIDLLHSCPYQHWRKLVQSVFSSSSLLKGHSDEYNISSPLVAAKPH